MEMHSLFVDSSADNVLF